MKNSKNTQVLKYYIKTFGCQANIADTNLMSGILESLGFFPLQINNPKNEVFEMKKAFKDADLVIVNSCSVRQKSEDKVYGMGKMIEKSNKKAFIILSGCMVGSVKGERTRFKEKILENKVPWVDDFLSTDEIYDLPKILYKNKLISKTLYETFDSKNVVSKVNSDKHAYVNISYGCDNFCSYCVVPYSRGREVHRSKEEIIGEIMDLVKKGITEITLCGQNVNSWGLDRKTKFDLRAGSSHKIPFTKLLRKVHEILEISKISFLSSNPFDFTQDLVDTLSLPKIDNYIHIAVQSGNNDILRGMNRRHTIEEFLDLINRIKKVRPNVELGTDLIVGFPGETESQFMDTVNLVKSVKFSVAFISMYSPRIGTLAQKELKDDISLKEKKRRHDLLTKVYMENKSSNIKVCRG